MAKSKMEVKLKLEDPKEEIEVVPVTPERAKQLDDIAAHARQWYEIGRETIPSIRSSQFASFVGSTSYLLSYVNEDAIKFDFTIKDSPAAYIDFKENKIVLPYWYFSPKALKQFAPEWNGDLEGLSLALCNGSHIHELLHSSLTTRLDIPNLIDRYSAGNDALKERNAKFPQAMGSIVNVFEDILNESFGEHFIDFGVYEFIGLKNSALFSIEAVNKLVDDYAKCESDDEKLAARLQFFTMMKNSNIRKTNAAKGNEDLQRIAEMARNLAKYGAGDAWHNVGGIISTVHENTPAVNREPLASMTKKNFFDAVYAIFLGLNIEAMEKQEAPSYGGIGGDGSEMEIEMAAIAQEDDKFSRASKTFNFELSARHSKKRPINAETLDMDKNDFKIRKVMYFPNLRAAKVTDPEMLEDTGNWSFVDKIRQLRTKNHTPGMLRTSGSKLMNNRLYKMAIDDKVFANNEFEKKNKRDVEIIILVDASGSMRDIYKKVVSNAYGFYSALRKAGFKADAYAHTGLDGNSAIPGLYKIAGGGVNGSMTMSFKAQFELALGIDLNENYDGFILKSLNRVGFRKFSQSRKLIFVLSDGQPSGDNYSGRDANNHTKDEIAALRKQDIAVIAVSLVESVINGNNEIYGEEFNVDGSKDLKASFTKMIIKLQEEGRL